jgi:Protease subunit of ATP-dependent Clp proteases
MADINIKGPIVPSDEAWIYDWFRIECANPKAVNDAIKKANGEKLDVYINSGGGDIFAGSEIYSSLRSYKGDVLIHVVGLAASAASVVASARESEIEPTAMLMVHNVSCTAQGDYHDMKHQAEVLQKANKTIANAYIAKTGMSEAEALALMDHETWLTAQEAVEKKLCDRMATSTQASGSTNTMQFAASYNSGMLPRNVIDKMRSDRMKDTKKRIADKIKFIETWRKDNMTKEQYLAQRKALMDEAQQLLDSGNIEGADGKMADVKKLDEKFEAIAKAQANLNAINGVVVAANAMAAQMVNGTQMITEQTYANKTDMYNSEEYRKAFMAKVISGTAIPAKFLNTDAQTVTSEVTSVIPSVLIQKIYSKLENVGKFFAMATKTNIKGGVTIPTSSVNLTASWVAERGTADTQEAPTGSITFAYRKLICKVAISFEASIVTLEMFETDFVDKVSKAMVKAVEQSMFTGSGSAGNQMVGFLTETPVTGQKIEITEGNSFTYGTLVAAEAAIPEEYEPGAIWVMPKKTFYNQIVALTDTTGQPIARVSVGIDGKPEHVILGRRVEFSPYMSAFSTTVSADTVVAAIFDFSRYAINTNYEMTIKKYTDEDTDDQITKAIMLVDGKTIDKNGLVTVVIKNS